LKQFVVALRVTSWATIWANCFGQKIRGEKC